MISYDYPCDNIAIQLKNITFGFSDRKLFDGFSIQFVSHQWTALLGKSGVGKSSLLKIIAGILPVSGEINTKFTKPLTTLINYMAQDDLLLPWLTVLDNVLLSYKLQNKLNYCSKEKALHLLSLVNLAEAASLYPHELSGGMRQRTAVARTLMDDKPIVLMDEPFSSLDMLTRYQLQNLTAQLFKEKTVIFITHDPNEAIRLADDIYVLQGCPLKTDYFKGLRDQALNDIQSIDFLKKQTELFEYLVNTKTTEHRD